MQPSGQRITIQSAMTFRDPLPAAVDVAIVGGGVIGITAALFLARAGKRVLVAEKGRVAGEQSSRNWGWIRQQGRDAAELPIMKDALHLWQALDRETGGACGVVQGGVYYLARTRAQLERYEAWLKVARAHDVDTKPLTRAAIDAAFSGQAPAGWIGGIVTPSDLRGEPWQAVPALAVLARKSGALIREGCAVRGFDTRAGQVTGIVTEEGIVTAEQVVVAGGAWSSLLLRSLGIDIPQLSVRETVMQTAPLPEFFRGAGADDGLALRRRLDGGYTLAGAGRSTVYTGPEAFRHFGIYLPVLRENWRKTRLHPLAPQGFPDAWTTPRRWSLDRPSPFEACRVLEPKPGAADMRHITRAFADKFPQLGRPAIRSAWAGMIDTMPDVVPVVDRVVDHPGLIVATGMSGHGFGIGPGFGQVVARMALGHATGHDLTRFRLSRFSDGSRMDPGGAL